MHPQTVVIANCIQRKLKQAIVGVLQILGGLADDIVRLLSYFEVLNTQISNLVEKHHEYLDVADDLEEDIETNPNASLNKHDKNSFNEKLFQMKKISAVVSVMAGLYGTVITNIVSPGFNLAVQQSHGSLDEENMSIVLYNKQVAMRDYLETAERECVDKSGAANRTLVRRLEVIEEQEAARSIMGGSLRRRARGVFGNSTPATNTARSSPSGSRNNSITSGGMVARPGSESPVERRRSVISRVFGR